MSGLTSPSNRRDAFAMVGLQLLMLALSAAFGRYDSQADAKTPLKDADKQTIGNYYPKCHDVSVTLPDLSEVSGSAGVEWHCLAGAAICRVIICSQLSPLSLTRSILGSLEDILTGF
uniref:Uncharacterized protein n=1 Tax=Timema cristinae TaxID=61476 RepID=A0A7R9D1W9_TIMCR|nr:unnamed protein product [Timema cristinae]